MKEPAKQRRETHNSRFFREKHRRSCYANLPYEQSHPRTCLGRRRRNERSISSSSFSSSPVTTQTNQCYRLQVTNKALFFQNPAGGHGPMSTFDANRLCILSTSNLYCQGDSSAVSSLLPRPLPCRLEGTQVLNVLFSIFVR